MSSMVREVINFNVEIVDGGQVGVETTVRLSADIKVESIADEAGKHDWAVAQYYIKYWLLNDEFSLIDSGKDEDYVTDYSREPGAYVSLEGPIVVEFTWTPETVGTYYIPARVAMFSGVTEGNFWPPQWNNESSMEQVFDTVEITAPVPASFSEGDFLVTIGDNIVGYEFDGLVISEEVDQIGIIDGHDVGIMIPTNTIVMGTGEIEVILEELVAKVVPSAIFSNPPALYVDGMKQ